jgi:hypothetical protein
VALFMIGIALGMSGAPIWQFVGALGALTTVGLLMTVAAFVLAIVGTVVAVRRPTRKREAVFALVYTSIGMGWIILRTIASLMTYGTL